jgi:hypothetical protein
VDDALGLAPEPPQAAMAIAQLTPASAIERLWRLGSLVVLALCTP